MMIKILIFIVFLLEGLCQAGAMSLRGLVGDDIQIKCSHSYASTNVKYFCKGPCYGKKILVTSREHKQSNSKYTLDNKGNTFYVRISDLTLKDSGTYWCGVERVGIDTYTKINLKVVEGSSENDANDSCCGHQVYIGVAFGVIALLLAVALLVFFRCRKTNLKVFSGKNGRVAETPSTGKETFLHASTPSSTGMDPHTHQSLVRQQDASISALDHTYAQVSHTTQSKKIEPIYSVISFSKNSTTVPPETAMTTYSSVKSI